MRTRTRVYIHQNIYIQRKKRRQNLPDLPVIDAKAWVFRRRMAGA